MVQILGNNKIIKLQKEKENLIKYFTTICACMRTLDTIITIDSNILDYKIQS